MVQAGRKATFGAIAVCVSLVAAAVALTAEAASTASSPAPGTLVHARQIRVQTDVRYRRSAGLAVTEASSTSVIESFTLLTPDLLGLRTVPAANGIWYAVCPVRATCPYPARRKARSAAELAPRRLALELAVRTFLETSADVVAVSLPTTRFAAFVVEREELLREADLVTLGAALRAGSANLDGIVDRITRPRTFLGLGLEQTASGRYSWTGVPVWPVE